MYKNIIHLFVLSCKKATFLIEKQLHTPLAPLEKLQLRIHLSLCEYCRAYKGKATFLHRLMTDKNMANGRGNHFSEQEVTDLKEKFKSAIKLTDQDGNC